MRALIISDLHANTGWPFSRPLLTGRPSRFQDLLDVLDQVQALVEREQPNDLLILGDLLHRRHFIQFALLNEMLARVAALAERVKQTTILVGNHDWEDAAGQVHGLTPFSYLPNTIVVDAARVVTLADGQEAVFALPYLPQPEAAVRAIELAPSGLPLIGHYAAEGVQLREDYWLDSPLKVGELGKFSCALFGHIHQPSAQFGGRVQYVGAPCHFDFGDVGPRYAWTFRDGTLTPHALTFPVFSTVAWPRIPSARGAGYVRILDVPAERLEEARESALALGWRDAVALPGALPPEVREAVTSGLALDRGLIEQYLRRRCPDLSEEESERTLAEGLELLKEVRGR